MTPTTLTTRTKYALLSVVIVIAAPSATHIHRDRQNRAAVALAVGFALAAGIQLASGWAIQSERVPIRDPQYTDKLRQLRKHPAFSHTSADRSIIVLFLGSSRTLDGIDAGAVGSMLSEQLGRPVEAFNFAHAGAGPVTNAIYLRRLLQDGVKPAVVVIEVHPAFLASQLHTPPEARGLSAVRLRPEEIPLVREFGFPISAPAAHGWRGWLLPWHEYRVSILDRYTPALSTLPYPVNAGHVGDRHGFVRVRPIGPAERARLLEATRGQYADFMPGFRPGGCSVEAIRDTLQNCRVAGCPAALLLTPESSEFRSWYPEPGRSHIAPLVAGIAREFGVPFIDAREWIADELFGDGHHLTGAGADLFTYRLTREALAPWLTKPKEVKP